MRGERVFGALAGRRMATSAALAVALVALAAGSASAASPAAGWTIESVATPTNFSTGDDAQCAEDLERCDSYTVTARDAGSLPTSGGPVTLTDALPSGLRLVKVEFFSEIGVEGREDLDSDCKSTPLECTFTGQVQPDQTLGMIVSVEAEEGASSPLVNLATVSGGGVPEASTRTDTLLSTAVPPFGVTSFDTDIAGLDGRADTQAGGHPYELTASIALNNVSRATGGGHYADASVQNLRDLVIELPLGFLASALATPTCTLAQLSSEGGCPPDTAVGYIHTEPESILALGSEVYNVVPEHGFPAEFGYSDLLKGAHVLYASVAPTPAGYVLRVTGRELPEVSLADLSVTLFGDPGEKDGSGDSPQALLTNPTACSGQSLQTSVHLDSWQAPGEWTEDGKVLATPDGPQATPLLTSPGWVTASTESPPVTGCEALAGLFAPSLAAVPQRLQAANPAAVESNRQADSPTGLELELKSPSSEAPEVDATPPLRTAVVTLPEGLTVDPSAGDGLQACSIAQIGWLGAEGSGGEPLPNGGLANFSAQAPECPEESKVGSVELTTPLFGGVLSGAVYLAAQDENPFQSALAAYVVVEDSATGVVLKIPAELKADPRTGRLTVVLAESPQLPFSDLKLRFFSGPRALLATPESCGTYTTTSELTPWSASESDPGGPGAGGGSVAEPLNSFQIDEGCAGGFAPSFAAGSTNLQAGANTPFQASFSREDSDQELGGWSVSLPPGLLADVGSVPLCPEASANAGTCPEASRVGRALAEAGPGPDPLSVSGKAYLTGPYNGGPFGLSIVVPVIAGPLDLGTVVVRQSLRIDPSTARITDVSNPFPTVLDVTGANGETDGIPIRLRRVDVSFERPGGAGFMFNPTSCAKLPLTGSVASAQGTSAAVSSPFQVTGCKGLPFKPSFTASTAAHAEALKDGAGASLNVRIASRGGASVRGEEANLKRVDLTLPRLLPARLQPTLQNACTAARFAKDPASCPPDSFVGTATAVTPMLDVPLRGPVIFVSRGSAALPDLDLVLQGEGVEIVLSGGTEIKGGVTYAKFEAFPDVPISSFALSLPQGPHSALASGLPTNKHSLCGQSLAMPATIEGQNGAVVKRSVRVGIAGCATHRAKKAKHRRRKKKSRGD